MAMAALFATACSSKDDDPTTPEEQKKDDTAVACVMDHDISVNDALFDNFDLTVDYYDTDGSIKSEKMTQKQWSKRVLGPLPFKMGGRVRVTLKEGADVTSDELLKTSGDYHYTVLAVNKDGELVGELDSKTLTHNLDLKRSKIPAWLELIEQRGRGILSIVFQFDEKGIYKQVSWGAE